MRSGTGRLIQLDNVVKTLEASSPPQLFRYNRYSAATIKAGLVPGETMGDGINAVNAIAQRVLDESYTTALPGPARDYSESSSSLAFAFIFALVLIYLVLAAQFESFTDSFIVMLTLPLAFAGALLSLWYFDQTLNIFSEIGIIMLIGLVTKNGILIVEFANQRKEAGLSVGQAILEASVSRFRPIVMTSLTAMLGALPIPPERLAPTAICGECAGWNDQEPDCRNATILLTSSAVRLARSFMWVPMVPHCSLEKADEGGVLWQRVQFSPHSCVPLLSATAGEAAHPAEKTAADARINPPIRILADLFMAVFFLE